MQGGPLRKKEAQNIGAKTPLGAKLRVNQILRGKPAEIVIELRRLGYFRTSSQAINAAVILLGDEYVERQLKAERLKTLEGEKE
jgi:Arc/MetJ-type ribon-helix-helix transcriptional regulator